MKLALYFLALFAFALYSCGSKNSNTTSEAKTSLIGKWHRFSMSNGYTEFNIDPQQVVFYNQKVGRFNLPYKIENDSLKYLTNQYAAKITYQGDSILLQGNDSTTATLYRFKEHVPFKTIPEERDSVLFAAYLKGFDKRLVSEFEKAGIAISDPAKKPDDNQYQQLLKKKNL